MVELVAKVGGQQKWWSRWLRWVANKGGGVGGQGFYLFIYLFFVFGLGLGWFKLGQNWAFTTAPLC